MKIQAMSIPQLSEHKCAVDRQPLTWFCRIRRAYVCFLPRSTTNREPLHEKTRQGIHQVESRYGEHAPLAMSEPLNRKKMSRQAMKELEALREWLSRARFEPLGNENCQFCSDNEGLIEHSSKLLACFEDEPGATETRITALRFEKGEASIPVKEGSAVDVVPMSITSETASIGGESVDPGYIVRLSKETPVEPVFDCLLLLRQGLAG